MSACRSCGAEVRWVKSEKSGKWMILDAAPSRESGNVVIVDGMAHDYRDWKAAVEAHPVLSRYVDHHVTCPSVDQWRKR